MPNLIVSISHTLQLSPDQQSSMAHGLEAALSSHIDVRPEAVNVILQEVVTSPATAKVFTQFIYRPTPERDAAFLEALHSALQAAIAENLTDLSYDVDFAFRAFAHGPETLFAANTALTLEAASEMP